MNGRLCPFFSLFCARIGIMCDYAMLCGPVCCSCGRYVLDYVPAMWGAPVPENVLCLVLCFVVPKLKFMCVFLGRFMFVK